MKKEIKNLTILRLKMVKIHGCFHPFPFIRIFSNSPPIVVLGMLLNIFSDKNKKNFTFLRLNRMNEKKKHLFGFGMSIKLLILGNKELNIFLDNLITLI